MRVARGLMNRRAPISGFESPSRESRDVVLMLGELIAGLDGALAGGLAGRGNWRRARSANASTPMPLSMSYAMRSCPRSTGPGGRTRRASGCSSWPNATRTKVGSSLPRHPRDVGVGEPDGDATARPSHPRRPGSCRPWTVPGTPPPRRRDPATVGHLRNAGQLSDLPYSRPAAATSRSSGAARHERWLGRRSGLALPGSMARLGAVPAAIGLRQSGLRDLTSMWLSAARASKTGCSAVAGPRTTEPSRTSNREP